MSTKDLRVARAGMILERYGFLSASEPPSVAIPALVAELGHYCRAHDLPYFDLIARGLGLWRCNITAPESLDPLPEVTIHIQESADHA